jgi:hypothetical protein
MSTNDTLSMPRRPTVIWETIEAVSGLPLAPECG